MRLESGRYRIVRDFWRSIYPVYSGRHDRLPLDDSRPLWERVALLQWWVKADGSVAFGDDQLRRSVPSVWEVARGEGSTGLLRHPDIDARVAACEDLLHMGRAQDECWDSLGPGDRQKLNKFWNVVPPEKSWAQNRDFEVYAHQWWDQTFETLVRAERRWIR